jgi:hypothetical protein
VGSYRIESINLEDNNKQTIPAKLKHFSMSWRTMQEV